MAESPPVRALPRLLSWLNARLPLTETVEYHATKYYAPKNFNFWYYFGILATVVLGIQLLTGIWLTMSYVPSGEGAFASVEYIMRDVEYGDIIRYLHSTGASAFFVVVYLHMFRALAYGSYRAPRELLWLIGMGIYLVLMMEGFFGYLLPCGQHVVLGCPKSSSRWSARSRSSDRTSWNGCGCDYLMSEITLNRFFATARGSPCRWHSSALVFLHIVALHHVGSNNPDGIEIKQNKDESGKPKDGIPFHPYYTVHDFQATVAVPLRFLRRGVLRARDVRLLPRKAEFRTGRSVEGRLN